MLVSAAAPLALTVVLHLPHAVRTAANDNVQAFTALCSMISVAKEQPSLAEATAASAFDTPTSVIGKLNMSVSPDSFYNLEFGPKGPDGKTSPEWTKNHEAWKLYKQAVEKGNEKIGGFDLKRLPSTHARRAAMLELNATLSQLGAIKEQYTAEPTKPTAEELLKKALYGSTGKLSEANEETFGASATDACNPASGAKKGSGMSLASDLLCVCESSDEALGCTGKGIGTATVYSSASSAKAAYEALVKKCPTVKHGKLTASAILAAVASFGAAVKTQGKATQAENIILGINNAANCNSGGADGCVKYKQEADSGKLDIPWLDKLIEAADSISKENRRRQKNQQLLKRAIALADTAILSYVRALGGDPPQKQLAATTQVPQAAKHSEETCNKHQSRDKCTEPCKWKEDAADKDKKCSLDPKNVAEQQATQEGTGEAKKEEKCAGKGEKECKDGCKWEGTECKDSSILVNKQFSLSMVSAAFAALLF
uniref:Variant surface glycoprotein 1963 n=2 Tax=Trypanosoma brucei TaxID=5691 RepID=M4T2F5_9TRYP|nr:variant surface glycoprotein 1963 [Trypanosoma brucei]